MGNELIDVCVKEVDDNTLSVPPGFESFAACTLKRVSCSPSATSSGSHSVPLDAESDICDGTKTTRSLRRRPAVNYVRLDESLEEELMSAKLSQNAALKHSLPKGVIRGCPQCSDCQKVTARWRPECACKPNLEDAPVFYPSEEEFEDTMKFMASIRPKAEPYGICRIVPPPSWKPPCLLKEKTVWEASKFATRVQRVDKLQNRDSMRKISKLYNHSRKKSRRCMSELTDAGPCGAEGFGFEPGPMFTLDTFQKYADDFKCQYFGKADYCSKGSGIATHEDNWEPSLESIEGEYWRIIEKATEEIEVLYGADVETGVFGSGFPKSSSQIGSVKDEWCLKSGWNLNNFPRLPGSVLSFESSDISGVLVPWLYVGMCFSSFCWHVEDHHLYSLNYNHFGAPKVWYGVPGKDATKLEEAMKKHLPDLFEEQPDLLHKLVTQLSPLILKFEGVSVYRCVQNSGEFVLTFPRAYHSGFNCGFNCAEAVNVAPVDWLPHGQVAIELYREQGRKTSISHDKVLLGAAREAVRAHWDIVLRKKNNLDSLRWREVCGKDGILAKTLKKRVEAERRMREFVGSSLVLKMDSSFDATSEKECSVCLFDLHLSAAGCNCSPNKFSCLNHANQLCSCTWGTKFFLFRYDISELDILVEALEGKLSAIYRWARLDLGLALAPPVLKDETHHFKLPNTVPGTAGAELISQPVADSVKALTGKGFSTNSPMISTGVGTGKALELRNKLHVVLGLKAQSAFHSSKTIKKDVLPADVKHSSSLAASVLLSSEEDMSYAEDTSGECGEKKQSSAGCADFIVLSDDEGVKLKRPLFEIAKENPAKKCSETPERILSSDEHRCDVSKSSSLTCSLSKASSISKTTASAIPTTLHSSCLSSPVEVKVEYLHHGRTHIESNLADSSCLRGSTETGLHRNVQDLSAKGESQNNAACMSKTIPSEVQNCLSEPVEVKVEYIQDGGTLTGSGPADSSCYRGSVTAKSCRIVQGSLVTMGTGEDKMLVNADRHYPQQSNRQMPSNENSRQYSASNPMDSSNIISGSPSCSQTNLDSYFRQKRPRIAKVVRRINCDVQPLEFGAVVSGKSWCDSLTIFPKGFRSRVRYISVLDPTSMCYYINEILDARRDGPLFMVSVEHCQSEVFVHVSASKCWEMVRERVNQEITKQHKLGRTNLPPLQPPGSLDGFEMFGFSSPSIVQAIEALDRNHVCTDYWDSRPHSRLDGQLQISGNSKGLSDDQNNKGNSGCRLLLGIANNTLKGLFKKATSDELCLLRHVLCDNETSFDRGLVEDLINEEFCNRTT